MKYFLILTLICFWIIAAEGECTKPDDWDDELDGTFDETIWCIPQEPIDCIKQGLCVDVLLREYENPPSPPPNKSPPTIVIGVNGWNLTLPDDWIALQRDIQQLREENSHLKLQIEKYERLSYVEETVHFLKNHLPALKSLIKEREHQLWIKDFYGVD